MALSNAERQRAYRQRHLKDGTADRINVVVDAATKARLERLARHYGVTQVAVLADLLARADGEVSERLRDDPNKLREYFDGVTE